MEYVDVIFYINLEHRTDRRAHIEKTIEKLCSNPLKVVRIDAVYTKNNGALGCAMSHLKALQQFQKNIAWNTCIVLEDDFDFLSSDVSENNYILKHVIETYPDWDAVSLTYNPERLLFSKIENDNDCIKIISHQTAAGYMLKKGELLQKLISCFTKCVFNLKKCNSNICALNIDQAWKNIQPLYNWYSTIVPMGKVIDGYSDICETNIHFTQWDRYICRQIQTQTQQKDRALPRLVPV